MPDGKNGKPRGAGGRADARVHVCDVVHDVPVREHDSFGLARGPGGVEERGRVGGGHARGAQVEPPFAFGDLAVSLFQHVFPRVDQDPLFPHASLGLRAVELHDDDLLQLHKAFAHGEQAGQDRGVLNDGELAVGMGNHVLDLAVSRPRAQRDVDAPGAQDGEVRDEPVLVVFSDDGHVRPGKEPDGNGPVPSSLTSVYSSAYVRVWKLSSGFRVFRAAREAYLTTDSCRSPMRVCPISPFSRGLGPRI